MLRKCYEYNKVHEQYESQAIKGMMATQACVPCRTQKIGSYSYTTGTAIEVVN